MHTYNKCITITAFPVPHMITNHADIFDVLALITNSFNIQKFSQHFILCWLVKILI